MPSKRSSMLLRLSLLAAAAEGQQKRRGLRARSSFLGLPHCAALQIGTPSENQGHYKQNQEDYKQNPGDVRRRTGQPRKAEETCNQRHNKEDHCPAQHDVNPPSYVLLLDTDLEYTLITFEMT
jgi:hypothetical protein